MRRARLVLEYDGTGFCGFQRQPDRPSVQGALEKALSRVCGHPVEVVGAGRTDAGVHALGQVVHFDTTGRIPMERIPAAVNSLVGPALCVRHAEETDPEFHARFHAARRTYDYFVTREEPGPVLARWVVGDPYLLPEAVERMRSALSGFPGERDFAAFCGAGADAGTTVRRVHSAEVEQRGELIRFRITANAFLKSMVRILAGLLLEIGEGRREPEALEAARQAGKREAAGVTAPARGLFLARVDYPDGFPGEKVRDTAPFWPAGK